MHRRTAVNSFEPIAAQLVEGLINGLWQGSLLAGLVWVSLRMLQRRINATTRFAIWWATLLLMLWLPWTHLQVASQPPLTADFHARPRVLIFELPGVVVRAPRLARAHSSRTPSARPASAKSAIHSPHLPQHQVAWPLPGGDWPLVLLGLWLGGAVAMLSRVLIAYWQLGRLKRAMRPLPARHQARLAHWLDYGHSRRRIRLGSCADIQVPVAVGLFEPVILIPEQLAHQLSEAQFDQVGLHELAHLRRWDDWSNLAQRLIEAVFFYHPAVRLIGGQLASEREIACDDWVVAVTGKARPYAECLARLVELLAHAPQAAAGSLSIGRQIAYRVTLLLDSRRPASPHLRKANLAVALFALALMAVISSHSPVIAVPVRLGLPVEPEAVTVVTPATVPAASAPPAAPQPAQPPVAPVAKTARPPHPPQPPVPPTPVRHPLLPRLAQADTAPQGTITITDGDGHRQMVFDAQQLKDTLKDQQDTIRDSVAAAMKFKDLGLEIKDRVLRNLKDVMPVVDVAKARPHNPPKSALSDAERLALLADIVRRDPDAAVRQEALRAIVRMRTEASVQTLVNLYDSTSDISQRRTLLRALARSDSKLALQKLVSIARNDPDAKLRLYALRALEAADASISVPDIDIQLPDVTIDAPANPPEPPEPPDKNP